MNPGLLVSTDEKHERFRVKFSLEVDKHLKRHPVAGVASTKTDVKLTIEAAEGKLIPDGEYDLHPEGSRDVIRVRKSGSVWTPLSITFGWS
jgi:hypothetical protein